MISVAEWCCKTIFVESLDALLNFDFYLVRQYSRRYAPKEFVTTVWAGKVQRLHSHNLGEYRG